MKTRVIKRRAAVAVIAAGIFASLFGGKNLLADDEGFRIQYKVGDGISFGDGDNLVHLQGRVQSRYTYQTIEKGPDTGTFSINRAEIRLDGFTLERKLKYGFEMNLATRARASTATACTSTGTATAACPAGTASVVTTESTTGLATLNDYFVDWVPTNYFGLQIGQFKVPFLMQQLTSSTKQQFVDRSLSTGVFDLVRDIGANVHGSAFEDKLKYNIFVMNGDGANALNRNHRAPLVGTRLEVPVLGTYEYSETDQGNSEGHNLGFGLGYAFNEAGGSTQSTTGAATIAGFTKAHHGTVDIGYKHRGLSLQGAGMISRTAEGSKLTNWGYNGQVGYFILPKVFEIAGRAGGAVFTNKKTNQYEYALGLNYFPMGKGHGIKFQTDYTMLLNDGGVQNINDHRVRAAMNLIF